MLRIEISIAVILNQLLRSGHFLIQDSGQNLNSQRNFSIQNCLRIADTQENTPIHVCTMPTICLGPCPHNKITLWLDLCKENRSIYTSECRGLWGEPEQAIVDVGDDCLRVTNRYSGAGVPA